MHPRSFTSPPNVETYPHPLHTPMNGAHPFHQLFNCKVLPGSKHLPAQPPRVGRDFGSRSTSTCFHESDFDSSALGNSQDPRPSPPGVRRASRATAKNEKVDFGFRGRAEVSDANQSRVVHQWCKARRDMPSSRFRDQRFPKPEVGGSNPLPDTIPEQKRELRKWTLAVGEPDTLGLMTPHSTSDMY